MASHVHNALAGKWPSHHVLNVLPIPNHPWLGTCFNKWCTLQHVQVGASTAVLCCGCSAQYRATRMVLDILFVGNGLRANSWNMHRHWVDILLAHSYWNVNMQQKITVVEPKCANWYLTTLHFVQIPSKVMYMRVDESEASFASQSSSRLLYTAEANKEPPWMLVPAVTLVHIKAWSSKLK